MVFLSSSTIIMSSFLAFFFPYEALLLSTFSLYILGLITVLAYLDYDFKIRPNSPLKAFKETTFYFLIIFLLVPGIQWYLAYFFVEDKSLRLGLFLSSICPPALIIPLFLKNNKDLIPKAHQEVLLFTFIFPPVMYGLLKIYAFNEFQVSLKNLFIDTFCVTALPISVLFLVRKTISTNFLRIKVQYRQFLSLLCIATLTFCYFGVAFSKSNIATVSKLDLVVLLILVIFQDFGVYFLMRWILRYFEKENDLLLTLLGSLRNVAIAGYVLIFYLPKAAIVPALVMAVHSIYFVFLDYKLRTVRV